jgi:hypothetical protein
MRGLPSAPAKLIAIGPIAVGRVNWLQIGGGLSTASDGDAGNRVAGEFCSRERLDART